VVNALAEHGPSQSARDQQALEAIQHAVVDGRVRSVFYTSGIWAQGDTAGHIVDESAPSEPAPLVAWRPAHEEVALDLGQHGARVVVFRPGMVYGGTRGYVNAWFAAARDHGAVSYVGGDQHGNMIHVDDVASAYALALEHAPNGARYLLADESHFTVRELAEAAAAAAGVPARAIPADQALATMGEVGRALLMDCLVTSARVRRELGWTPMHTSFVNEATTLYAEWQAGVGTRVA
jgi:nucleoside-diphosphate-sugar epimerase